MATYRVIQGINYKDRRVEPGDLVDDIPTRSVKWLVDQGIIEKVEGGKTTKSEPDLEPVVEVWEFDEESGDDL